MNKEETAEWLGYDTVEAMDRDHDKLHTNLAAFFGVTSYSMALANGAYLSHEDYTLANYEEDAVLHVQRWLRHIGFLDG